MSKGWERFFHLLTYVCQGSSYLNPRAYAILHRQHHAYSDTEKDPHSPLFFGNVFTLMIHTKRRYDAYAYNLEQPEARFDGGCPSWPLIDRLGQGWTLRILWGTAYTLVYIFFAQAWWMWLLLPFHYLMGPVHGAIVNWCGHRYGYRNFDNKDDSRNCLPIDFVTLGELFQNNHHKYGSRVKFSVRRFEVDPCYAIIRVFDWLGIIQLDRPRHADTQAKQEQKTATTIPTSLPLTTTALSAHK